MSTIVDIERSPPSKFFPRLPVTAVRREVRIVHARPQEIAEAERRGYEAGIQDAKRQQDIEMSMPTMRQIAEEVAAKHGLASWKQLRSHRRNRPLVQARQECWWRCREETVHSFPAIGRFFGFDHTSVLMACRRHAESTIHARYAQEQESSCA